MGNRIALWMLVVSLVYATRAHAFEGKSVILAASVESLLFVDMMQTINLSHNPHFYEMNPVLGRHPSNAAIVGYFAAVGVGYAVAYKALPTKWGNLLSVGMLGLEAVQLIENRSLGIGLSF